MSKSETSICELPPLPKGDIAADTCPVMWVHTDQQIENYALAAIEPYKQRIEELEAELQELRWQWVEHDTLGCPTAKTGIYASKADRQQRGKPEIKAVFECVTNDLVGVTDAEVKRIECQDDGSCTVVIDHWPSQDREDAGEVMEILDTGEWSLVRSIPGEWLTDDEHRWCVQRQLPPYCGKDGAHCWTGPTAISALRAGMKAIDHARRIEGEGE